MLQDVEKGVFRLHVPNHVLVMIVGKNVQVRNAPTPVKEKIVERLVLVRNVPNHVLVMIVETIVWGPIVPLIALVPTGLLASTAELVPNRLV